jgi:multicomponent Na+:H+ antiporter subunit E
MNKVIMTLVWFLVWLGLSRPGGLRQVITGAVVAIFVSIMTYDIFERHGKVLRSPTRLAWFVYYIAVFLWECVKANIDVAYRVIHPAVPIRPGTVRVKTSLKSDIALTFLASSITLTPGTTTVDIDREAGMIYIHWLYVKGYYDKEKMSLPVVRKFEDILRRIFE